MDPIAQSATGRDCLCFDLAPAEGGTVGQILTLATDADVHAIVAPSFADLLSLYFEGLQTGEIAPFDDDLDDEDDDED